MELENIVANTVYIKARECGSDINKGRSKKWRKILQLPHISYCIDVKEKVDCCYSFVVEHQPIGRLLFRQFCETNPLYGKCNNFLDVVESFEVQDQTQLVVAQDIFDRFLIKDSKDHIEFLNPETVTRCMDRLHDNSKSQDVFIECTKEVKTFLSGEPFQAFEESMYFLRYLQWKFLESQPVTHKTFRMYRVLGKGGFGEVCACQVRATGKVGDSITALY